MIDKLLEKMVEKQDKNNGDKPKKKSYLIYVNGDDLSKLIRALLYVIIALIVKDIF